MGRTIKAVRDNEIAAAAYSVRPVRVKLQAFSIAGALAGLGGALLAGAFANIAFTGNFFLVNDSLNLVAMVVIGGMGSVSGAVIGAICVIGIPALAPNNAVVGLLTSSLGLLVVLLYFPRGLNADHLRRPRRHPLVGRSPLGGSMVAPSDRVNRRGAPAARAEHPDSGGPGARRLGARRDTSAASPPSTGVDARRGARARSSGSSGATAQASRP